MRTKRNYILLVRREVDGSLRKVAVPLGYVYIFVGAAAIGLFTVAGLAGSYTRMLIKTAQFNQLRTDHNALQRDYAHLERQARQKDVQAASLGALASEVSALYGFTAGKLSNVRFNRSPAPGAANSAQTASLAGLQPAGDTYTHSLDAFYSLRSSAMSGGISQLIEPPAEEVGTAHPYRGFDNPGSLGNLEDVPSLWPIIGPITSSFGQREDPILGGGEGEFHPGIDISSPQGTPIHATADGFVRSAGLVNGYGRLVAIDHGHGLITMYGHMSGFAVTTGQQVTRGQVIGYVGHSGRTTGNHVHYEVRIDGAPVNPHKYLRVTLAQLDPLR